MARDSFIFYGSFYEAIKRLPKDVQAEIYPAIAEYALMGTIPDEISEVAMAVFLLIQPNIDANNKRFENGKKGAAYGKRGGRPRKNAAKSQEYTLTFEQEVEQMKADANWAESICTDYALSSEGFAQRLSRFLKHCNDTRSSRPHDSLDDAKNHFRYWMEKIPDIENKKDDKKARKTSDVQVKNVQKQSRYSEERKAMYENMEKNASPPSDYIRSLGYDPDKVNLAQVLNPNWRAENPPSEPP